MHGLQILVVVNPGHGHLNALLPTCWALLAAGHQVVAATTDDFVDVIAATGVPAVACGRPPTPSELARLPPSPVDREARLLWSLAQKWPTWAEAMASDLLGFARSFAPQVVLHEPTAFAGPLVAALLGLPCIEHGWGMPLPAEMAQLAEERLRPLHSRHGLGPAVHARSVRINLGPQAFVPGDAMPTERFRFVPVSGTVTPAPSWVTARRHDRRRLLISFGTWPDPQAQSVQRAAVVAALAAGAEVVVALGHPDRGTVAELPAEVLAAFRPPVSLLMPTCDAVIHHGGAGTACAALAYGLPALVLPQRADQFRNAERLAASGAARYLLPEARADRINDEVAALLADAARRTVARQLQAANAALPPLAALVTLVEQLAAARGAGPLAGESA